MENENQIPIPQRRSKQEVQALIEQWKQSGKSKALFCLENNLNYQTFFGWVKPKKKKHSVKDQQFSKSSGFVALKVKPDTEQLFAELNFPGGIKLSLHQTVPVAYLKELIR